MRLVALPCRPALSVWHSIGNVRSNHVHLPSLPASARVPQRNDAIVTARRHHATAGIYSGAPNPAAAAIAAKTGGRLLRRCPVAPWLPSLCNTASGGRSPAEQ